MIFHNSSRLRILGRMNVIEKMVVLAKRKGLDQGELEQLAGLPKGRISKWKGGTGSPTVKQAVRIARELGVDVGFLLDDSRSEPAEPLTPGERGLLAVYRELALDRDPDRAVSALFAAARGDGPQKPVGGVEGDKVRQAMEPFGKRSSRRRRG